MDGVYRQAVEVLAGLGVELEGSVKGHSLSIATYRLGYFYSDVAFGWKVRVNNGIVMLDGREIERLHFLRVNHTYSNRRWGFLLFNERGFLGLLQEKHWWSGTSDNLKEAYSFTQPKMFLRNSKDGMEVVVLEDENAERWNIFDEWYSHMKETGLIGRLEYGSFNILPLKE